MAANTQVSTVGKEVPDFLAPGTHGEFHLAEKRGAPLLLYFYPKDNTPGCITEAAQLRDAHDEFARLRCNIIGISRDSLRSHQHFAQKLGLPFALLADEDGTVCRLFDVIRDKQLYGKTVRGIERSSFLLDAAGIVRAEWRKVRADGHAAEVLRALAAC